MYVDIGRGHPFYLDGIIEALIRKGNIRLMRGRQDVFEISQGVARLSWMAARWIYRQGASSRTVGGIDHRIRDSRDYNRPSTMLTLMGRDIRKRYLHDSEPLVVSHPTLVGILEGKSGLLYQHGELVVPGESLVRGAEFVIVPTDDTALEFLKAGYSREQILVSGLCIEPALTRQAADSYTSRISRLHGSEVLTGAMFSSGAEPKLHVRKIVIGALSSVKYNGRAVVFAQRGGQLARAMLRGFHEARKELLRLDSTTLIPIDLPGAVLAEFSSRREEDILTARLFPLFDYLVLPSHERSNWALGLGLPAFILEPQFGPFAPLNKRLLVGAQVAEPLTDDRSAASLGTILQGLRESGRLMQMAENGWGRGSINGFEQIAEFLNSAYAAK